VYGNSLLHVDSDASYRNREAFGVRRLGAAFRFKKAKEKRRQAAALQRLRRFMHSLQLFVQKLVATYIEPLPTFIGVITNA
jgi:hypothetical protein